jgi:hypothetical protein
MTVARFGAVIVNYNSAPLAIAAALSFLGDGGAAVVIVDNLSTDDSRATLVAARAGDAEAPEAPREPAEGRAPLFAPAAALAGSACELVLSEQNGGFAAGCNIGLKRLMARGDCTHFLLLNPDALIAKGSLAAFSERLADPSVGLCGATVAAFDPPHPVQAFGGARVSGLLPVGRNIGEGSDVAQPPARSAVERQLSYPLGAAIAFRRDYLDRAGFLDERYFLYFEEFDFARAGRGLNSAWADGALIYHRYGASSKSRRAAKGVRRSPLADYHMARSRLLFVAKWRPMTAPLALLLALAEAGRRLGRGDRENARAVLAGSLPGSPRIYSAPGRTF